MVRGAASPFLKIDTTARNIVSAIPYAAGGVLAAIRGDKAEEQRLVEKGFEKATQERDYGYLGKTKPIMTPKEALGVGIEAGSNFIGGTGAVSTVAKGVTKPALIRTLGKLSGYGAASGGASTLGSNLQKDAGVVETAVNTALGTAIGAGTGFVLGGLSHGATKGVNKALGYFSDKIKAKNAYNGFNNAVKEYIPKITRPSVKGKTTPKALESYEKQAAKVVADLVDNKSTLQFKDEFGNTVNKLPETRKEFLEAVEIGKKRVLDNYKSLSSQSTKAGAKIDLSGLPDQLDNMANTNKMRLVNPGAAKYAQQQAEELRRIKTLDPVEIEDVITAYNAKLDAFYNNPNPNDVGTAYVDAFIVNNLRDYLDNTVSKLTGTDYQALKNLYGAYRAIEKDLTKQVVIENRKAAKGLIDFTDIMTMGDVFSGIATFNPIQISKGVSGFAVKEMIKRVNNTDRMVKNMFKTADKSLQILQKTGQQLK